LSAVVGVEVSIDSIKGQWKLSQNQPVVNKVGVVKGLLERGGENDVQVSHLVKERL
jgi:transcriptional regulator